MPNTASKKVNGATDLPIPLSKKDDNVIKSPALMSCVKQPVFLTHCLWYSTLLLRFYYFMGSHNSYLNRLLYRDNDLGMFSSIVYHQFDAMYKYLSREYIFTKVYSFFIGLS